MSGKNIVVLRQFDARGAPRWIRFEEPVAVIQTNRLAGVLHCIRQIEQAVAKGQTAAGFLAYEAAAAFDPALVTRSPGPLPLLWFGIYQQARDATVGPADQPAALKWKPNLTAADFDAAVRRIKSLIAGGETYQVNYSFRLRAPFEGDAWNLFRALHAAQRRGYSAFIDAGDWAVCSASPELFFRLDGDRITCRPMKGTAPRGLHLEDDAQRENELLHSAKNRAENIMIVDMIRNDLGRIAETGSVKVARLFDVERHETLWQMTSTVEAKTQAALSEIFRALFPCASVTGAPKVRTMEIIADLETAPRGIYTGCIGYVAPGRKAQFNVAIRTVHVDRRSGQAEYGTGAGIVWDSQADQEYEECKTKALVLQTDPRPFELLETILWRPHRGFFLLDEHLERLAASAAYFDFALDLPAVSEQLMAAARNLPPQPHRIRLLIAEDGKISVEPSSMERLREKKSYRVTLAKSPVDSGNRTLYHKTTRRDVYNAARAESPGFDDVLLWNERGELTESTIANLVIRRADGWITPPVRCGLLNGVYRRYLLKRGWVREDIIRKEDLAVTSAVCLINSVRGWMRVSLVLDRP